MHLGFMSIIFLVINIMVITFQNQKVLEHPFSWTHCCTGEETEAQKGGICSRSYCRIGAGAKNQILWPRIHYNQIFGAGWGGGQSPTHLVLSSGLSIVCSHLHTRVTPVSDRHVKKYTRQNFLTIYFHLSSNLIILQNPGSMEKKNVASPSQCNLC